MKNFHIKSLILGIGIGIVMTSIISIIYLAGMDPAQNLSEEEIIRLAGKYGMVKSTSLLTREPEQQAQRSDDQEIRDTAETKFEGLEVEVSIKSGDTSEIVADKLLKAGLIEDRARFIKELDDMGLSTRISIGKFKIKKGIDLKSIIKMITNS